MVETTRSKSYISDISGDEIAEENWLRLKFKSGSGQTYLLDASEEELSDLGLFDHARKTERGRQVTVTTNGNSQPQEISNN